MRLQLKTNTKEKLTIQSNLSSTVLVETLQILSTIWHNIGSIEKCTLNEEYIERKQKLAIIKNLTKNVQEKCFNNKIGRVYQVKFLNSICDKLGQLASQGAMKTFPNRMKQIDFIRQLMKALDILKDRIERNTEKLSNQMIDFLFSTIELLENSAQKINCRQSQPKPTHHSDIEVKFLFDKNNILNKSYIIKKQSQCNDKKKNKCSRVFSKRRNTSTRPNSMNVSGDRSVILHKKNCSINLSFVGKKQRQKCLFSHKLQIKNQGTKISVNRPKTAFTFVKDNVNASNTREKGSLTYKFQQKSGSFCNQNKKKSLKIKNIKEALKQQEQFEEKQQQEKDRSQTLSRKYIFTEHSKKKTQKQEQEQVKEKYRIKFANVQIQEKLEQENEKQSKLFQISHPTTKTNSPHKTTHQPQKVKNENEEIIDNEQKQSHRNSKQKIRKSFRQMNYTKLKLDLNNESDSIKGENSCRNSLSSSLQSSQKSEKNSERSVSFNSSHQSKEESNQRNSNNELVVKKIMRKSVQEIRKSVRRSGQMLPLDIFKRKSVEKHSTFFKNSANLTDNIKDELKPKRKSLKIKKIMIKGNEESESQFSSDSHSLTSDEQNSKQKQFTIHPQQYSTLKQDFKLCLQNQQLCNKVESNSIFFIEQSLINWKERKQLINYLNKKNEERQNLSCKFIQMESTVTDKYQEDKSQIQREIVFRSENQWLRNRKNLQQNKEKALNQCTYKEKIQQNYNQFLL